jgi:methylated-DNA-protein-cysteine methyltransferase-like protein
MPHDPLVHGPRRVVGPGFHARVHALVRRVPAGFVTTYGDVAEALGLRRAARHVGYALAALPSAARDVPWQRVVNGRGLLSSPDPSRQRRLLRAEGIEVDRKGRIARFAEVRLPVEALEKKSVVRSP